MPPLFWTGKMPFFPRMMINTSSIIAWISGNARNTFVMKQRVKNGYNGNYSDYVDHYDEFGAFHYEEISRRLLQKIDCKEKKIVDVGCGTGILSLFALDKGAASLSCVDISSSMLEKCKKKLHEKGYGEDRSSFHEADAEWLPFDENTFDLVLFNMVLGMIPNQQETIKELVRVLQPGGTLAISAHGPSHYVEATEACVKSMNMRYFFGHRMEFWPRDEKEIKTFFMNAGLVKIQTDRLTWIDEFEHGREVFDFFASTSSLWWYDRLPPELREKETDKIREYFQGKEIKSITSDVIFALGIKT